MDPLITPALIAGGAALVGQGANAFAQGKMNKKTREWNEKMYAQQKQDSLDFWDKQNSYNKPEAQMQRLNEAGLNPNLVYGNGTVANSASAPDTPHAMGYSPKAPQFDVPQIADTYFNMRSRAQELSNQEKVGNNLQTQNALMQADLINKQLNNKFSTETYESKMRGFLGDNEQKYSSAISSFINKDLLETLSNQTINIHGKGVTASQYGDPGDSFLVKDYMQKYQGGGLSNALKKYQIEGLKSDNKTKAIEAQYRERLRSGRLEDMSAQDWIKMLMGGLGLIPDFSRMGPPTRNINIHPRR